jgi:hypothetical protein
MTSAEPLSWKGSRLAEVSYPSPGQLIMTTKRIAFQTQKATDRLFTGRLGSRKLGTPEAIGFNFGGAGVIIAVWLKSHETELVGGTADGIYVV